MSWRNRSILFIVSILMIAGYLLISKLFFRPGFPLDDAWIHQTFARNLALYGEWSFLPEQTSAGSTSPLWTGLQAVGYIIGLSPIVWSALTGGLALFFTGQACEQMWRMISPASKKYSLPLAGLLIISEWHLVWASVSGMETMLFILFICLTLSILIQPGRKWILSGLLTGLAVWVRPDGITLLGPVLFILLMSRLSWQNKLQNLLLTGLGLGLILLPYFMFNKWLDGSILPNTYFAKQAEYAASTQAPILFRWVRLFSQIQIGIGLALLPGFIVSTIRASQRKDWWHIAVVLFVTGYVLVFAVRLPVIYQHARYLMPVIPVYVLIGFTGFIALITEMDQTRPGTRIIKKTWVISLILLAVAFYGLGGYAYAIDVAIIESEMVAAAQWISENSPADAVIAAHDIGALGYYGNRNLIDLAGLVNPEVIPFIRDEQRLLVYMQSKGADYLLTFPGWYPEIVSQGQLIYTTGGSFSADAGGENMSIFRLRW